MWRLIVSEGPAEFNMALDEALLVLRNGNKISNTLRLYTFKPSAATIGYFQKIAEVIDLNYARERSIPIVRRITGGGAVYHDQNGEITYSVTASTDDFPSDIQETFENICKGIVYAINELGLEAKFEVINDVVVRGKKVSGSAQTRKNKALLQHGTLMYNTDIITLGKLFRVPKEKLIEHGVRTIFDRVTTVSRELGRTVPKQETINAMVSGFGKAFKTEFHQTSMTFEEVELANKIEEKCKSREWNYRR